MAEVVDAADSKSAARKGVSVRVRSPANYVYKHSRTLIRRFLRIGLERSPEADRNLTGASAFFILQPIVDRNAKTGFDRDDRYTTPSRPCLPFNVHRRRQPHFFGRSPGRARRISTLAMFGLLLALTVMFGACRLGDDVEERADPIDLTKIQDRGTLRVITSYGPLSYFIYRGQPMGFEYELIDRFADWLEIDVEILPATDINEMLSMVETGEGDMIAYRLSVTSERRERVAFSDVVTATRQVLVQPARDATGGIPAHDAGHTFIQEPEDLADREVHVRAGSAYVGRLRNLQSEIGEQIDIVEAPADVTTEELIEAVHRGEIPLTVADENIARISASFFDEVDVSIPLSLSQRTAWAVRHESTDLLEAINDWLAEEKQRADFFVIYNRYFNEPRGFRTRLSDEAFTPIRGQISPWDDQFREAARSIGWDWRLLAALAFQESRFDPNARSWAGAVGLMQLMPATARQFGTSRLTDPEASIKAASRFLAWLDETWSRDIESEEQRRPFVLASYNVGRGHVQDARRLAEYYGADADNWDEVSPFLLRKSDPNYYSHQVVQFGYARGAEPVAYVRSISRLYRHYVRFTDDPVEEPPPDPAEPPDVSTAD